MPNSKVFDSWALLSWLLDQPAAGYVEELLQKAEHDDIELVMSWINIGEVYYMATRKAGPLKAAEFLNRLPSPPIRLVVPEPADFIEAAPQVDEAHFVR
jgi:predicted nucleic acid-binding protein